MQLSAAGVHPQVTASLHTVGLVSTDFSHVVFQSGRVGAHAQVAVLHVQTCTAGRLTAFIYITSI